MTKYKQFKTSGLSFDKFYQIGDVIPFELFSTIKSLCFNVKRKDDLYTMKSGNTTYVIQDMENDFYLIVDTF